jgi:hypothetical protein
LQANLVVVAQAMRTAPAPLGSLSTTTRIPDARVIVLDVTRHVMSTPVFTWHESASLG